MGFRVQISRFREFLSVAVFIFRNGFKASPAGALLSVFFDSLSFIFLVGAALSLITFQPNAHTQIPDFLKAYVNQDNIFLLGCTGLILSLLLNAIFKFLSSIVVNKSLPAIESYFYKITAEKIAQSKLNDLVKLHINYDDFLLRELNINSRFAMMVYRGLISVTFPMISLIILFPLLLLSSLIATLMLIGVFIAVLPVYYLINKRSNRVTLDIDTTNLLVSNSRRQSSRKIIDPNFDVADLKAAMSNALQDGNRDVRKYFHLYGERFTLAQGTSLTNSLVLILAIAILGVMTFWDTGSLKLDVAKFVTILIVLRQVHTVIGRGFIAVNIMSRFYFKLLKLSKIYKLASEDNANTPAGKLLPSKGFKFTNLSTKEPVVVDCFDNRAVLFYDRFELTRFTIVRTYPPNNLPLQIELSRKKVCVIKELISGFTFTADDSNACKKQVNKYIDVIALLVSQNDIYRQWDSQQDDLASAFVKSVMGVQRYVLPRHIKIIEKVIGLVQAIKNTTSEIVLLDARVFLQFGGEKHDVVLEMLEAEIDKVVIIKLNNANYNFSQDRFVVVGGIGEAEGIIRYGELPSLIVGDKQPVEDDEYEF
ncbi:MAG: hypothetical protein L3J65_03625 [Robiginitomaculum sp.]|nr:hypothetical protein [Robiginitomaculum sp.]